MAFKWIYDPANEILGWFDPTTYLAGWFDDEAFDGEFVEPPEPPIPPVEPPAPAIRLDYPIYFVPPETARQIIDTPMAGKNNPLLLLLS